jgi:GT2 family glycosyltransferase
VIRNEANRGFATACNQGAAAGRGDLLLFLNPDTEVFPETLDRCVAYLVDPVNEEVGICGGLMVDERGRPEFSCARFPTLTMVATKAVGVERLLARVVPPQRMQPEELTESRTVDQVIGAFLLIRRSLFDRLSGFDERFFMYYEDVDLAYRVRALGYSNFFIADAVVFHKEGVSSGQVLDRRLAYQFRARTQYATQHWSKLESRLLVVLTLAVELPVRLLRSPFGVDRTSARDVLAAGRLYLGFLLTGRWA